MKAIHTIASLHADCGGPSRTIAALCEALVKDGVDVDLITSLQRSREGSASPASFERLNILSVAPQSKVNAFSPATSRLAKLVDNKVANDPSIIVHDHGIWLPSNHAVVRAAARSGNPIIVSPRGMLSSWALAYRRWKKRAAWVLYQRRDLDTVNVFHVTSSKEANDLRSLGFKQPIALIPNGVHIPDESQKKSWDRVARRALFLSRIHPVKGLLNLIEAWARVRPAGWELVIAGPDENGHQAEVEQAIQARGITEDVTFIGAVNDQEKWVTYSQADLFVLPSFSESFGMAIAEALASGLPVITTKAAPWVQLGTRECGWWIDTDVDSLARALKEATELPDERRITMGCKGRAFVGEKYSWRCVAEEMRSVYGWMLGVGNRPRCVQLNS